MKRIFSTIILCSAIAGNGSASESSKVRPSKLILNTFSSQCSQVVTNDVSASLGTLSALYGIVDELKNDKDCAGATQLASALSRYGSLYDDFQTQSSESQNMLVLEKKIALYSTLVGNAGLTSDQLSFLNTEIVKSQSDLVSIKAGLSRFQSFSGREARGANQLVLALDSFLSNLSQDQSSACYKKHGAEISALVSNALLATSAFAAPGASLALASGGVIVSSIGSYVENFKYNKTLDRDGDIEMPIALRCVSQVLTTQYCSADTMKSLINDRLNGQSTPAFRYEGIALLSYQLTALSKWLDEVYAGSEITSQGDLINREKPIQQAEFLKKVKRYIETYGTIKKKFFENIADKGDRSTAIAKAIQGLAYIMDQPSLTPGPRNMFSGGNSDFENPIFIANSQPLMPYTLWSPGTVTVTPSCDGMPCTLDNYLAQKSITLDMNNWIMALANADKILQNTIDRVNIERAKTVSVDAYSIMVNAKRELRGEVNPYLALQKINANADRIMNYLSTLGCKKTPENCESFNNKYFPQISNIQKTQEITSNIIKLVEEATIPRSIPDDVLPKECRTEKLAIGDNENNSDDVLEKKSFQITSCISKILKLEERGTDVYFSKIRNMISYEMEARLANNDLGPGLEDIVGATKSDLLQSILNSYASNDSSISVEDLKTGLETAQSNSKETLDVFFDFFKKDITDAIKGDKLPLGPKADLCFRVLPYLDESNQTMMKDVYESCKDMKKGSYNDGPKILFADFIQKSVGRGLLKKSKYHFKDNIDERARFCAYTDYHNASLLYDEQIKRKNLEQSIKLFGKKFSNLGPSLR
ncbi:MAG: hypothetical protein ACXVCE_11615 [Bacteriovorax sp.]